MKRMFQNAATRGVISAAALLLMCAGLATIARPVWHVARRVVLHYQARSLWNDAKGSPSIEDGSPAAWLTIPEAGIDTLVMQGVTEWALHQFPCVMRNTSIPAILAHRDTHFRGLAKVSPGTAISLQLPDSSIRIYKVVETEVLSPEQAEKRLHEKSDADWLVLLTCYPFRYIGAAPQRFLVWARSTD